MRLVVSGYSSEWSVLEQCHAAEWMGRSVCGPLFCLTSVNIVNVEGYKNNRRGCIIPLDYLPRSFMIEISTNQSAIDQMITLAHEMIHLGDMALGMLKIKPDNGAYYKEKEYPVDTPENEKPWEIKAYKFERVLYEEYVGSLKRALQNISR